MVFVHRPPEVTPVPAAARRLLEVTLQQALQSLAVTGLVSCYFIILLAISIIASANITTEFQCKTYNMVNRLLYLLL